MKIILSTLIVVFLHVAIGSARAVSFEGHAKPLEKMDKIYAPEDVDTEARLKNADEIFSQLNAALSCPDGGLIKFTMSLHRSGKVTEVKVERLEGCKTSKAPEKILRKLKFSPAMKDGLKVSQSETFEIRKEIKVDQNVSQN